MTLNLNNTVVEFLQQNPEKKFTAREIANWIFETYPNECTTKMENSQNKRKQEISSQEEMDKLLIGIWDWF